MEYLGLEHSVILGILTRCKLENKFCILQRINISPILTVIPPFTGGTAIHDDDAGDDDFGDLEGGGGEEEEEGEVELFAADTLLLGFGRHSRPDSPRR